MMSQDDQGLSISKDDQGLSAQQRLRSEPQQWAGNLEQITEQIERISNENQRLFVRLVDGERRFRALAKAVWQVQEEERRRLARELHDGIGQTLTALKNQLERLAHGNGDQALILQLNDLAEIASSALNDTRELSRLLRPPVLDDLGLFPALQWLTRTLCERTGLRVRLEWELEEQQLRPQPDIETLIFRVVQEALNNVVKHAGVDNALVRVVDETRYVGVQVADEGNGFNAVNMLEETATGAVTGTGLRGIRDRLELFGGSLEVHSAPRQGTLLHMRVPLEENYPSHKQNQN